MAKQNHYKITDLNAEKLWQLRTEVVLNSIFVEDYENSFGFDAGAVCNFFDGYVDYLWDMARENGYEGNDIYYVADKYDNADNLFDYYWGTEFDDTDYTPDWSDEDEEEYCRYWNGQ